jgi:hypothetical protein
MALLADTARFREDDPDELVAASLACPLCLRSDQVVWEAALAPHQTLRISLLSSS